MQCSNRSGEGGNKLLRDPGSELRLKEGKRKKKGEDHNCAMKNK